MGTDDTLYDFLKKLDFAALRKQKACLHGHVDHRRVDEAGALLGIGALLDDMDIPRLIG